MLGIAIVVADMFLSPSSDNHGPHSPPSPIADGLISLLEPIMIAFLGTIIGGIVIAMYMPMFDLINKI